MAEAIVGFVGVLVGTLTTSVLTVCRERWASRQELAAREAQYERERRAARDAFQRDSVLNLQVAATDLIKAANAELDRLIAVNLETGAWSRRRWETPTAVGWSEALLALESSRARVFDDELRVVLSDIRALAGDAIWADRLETAKTCSRQLERVLAQLNTAVTRVLPTLY